MARSGWWASSGRGPRRIAGRRAWLLAVAALVAAAFVVLPPQGGGTADAAGGVPGTLDPTFDTDGIAVDELMSHLGSVDSVARLSNGSILVLADGLVWRFFADGTLDTSFDGDGVLRPPTANNFRPVNMALRPGDAGFVLTGGGGNFNGSCSTGQVAEFTANGSLEPGFDASDGTNDGVACIAFPNFEGGLITDVTVQPDGKIVVLGSSQAAGQAQHLALARLTTTGATDRAIVQALSDGSSFEGGDDLVVQPDGKILVAGHTAGAPGVITIGEVLARYTADTLVLDTTFSGNGIATENTFLGTARAPVKVALAVDGTDVVSISTVVAGDDGGSPRVPQLEQLMFDPTSGNLDDSPLEVNVSGTFVTLKELVPTDTGYIAIGQVEDSSTLPARNSAVAYPFGRGYVDQSSLTPLDLTFPGGSVFAGRSFLQPADGKLLHVGVLAGPGGGQLMINRMLENHTDQPDDPRSVTLDPTIGSSFGQPGFLTRNAVTTDRGEAVTAEPDGDVLVGGVSGTASGGPGRVVGGAGFVLRRLAADGALDAAFGGPVRPGVAFLGFKVFGLAAQADGAMVAAGSSFNGNSDVGPFGDTGAAQRLLANGAPDPTWNKGNPTFVRVDDGAPGTFLRDVAVQPDGKVVAVGDHHGCTGIECTNDNTVLVVRFNADGTPDSSFGTNGRVLVGHVAGSELERALGNGVALQTDGKIVVTGSLNGQLVVARLTTGGAPDGTFAAPAGAFGPGVLVDDLQPGVDTDRGNGRDVALRPDGRIVVGGDMTILDCSAGLACFTRTVAIATQYLAEGKRDESFDAQGPFPGLALAGPVGSKGAGVAVDGSGNVLVAGTATVPGGSDLLLSRLQPAGAPDTAFGTTGNGQVFTGVGETDAGNDLALAPDGRILVTGLNNDTRGDRVVTARYEPGAALLCSPTPLNFGSVVLGNTGNLTVTCTNTGPSRLVLTQVATAGTNPGDFVAAGAGCLVVLSPGQSCQVPVTFAPTGVGARNATLTVTHNAQGAAGPVAVALTGIGIARNTTLTFKPPALNYAEQLGLSTSPAQTVTVTNTGTVPVTINGVAVENDPSGHYAISASTCTGTTLAPGASCQVSVTFTPKAAGALGAALRFDDTGVGTPHRVPLNGTGATPAVTINPGVGPGGTITVATGAKFPPNQAVTLVWAEPTTLAVGTFAEPSFTVNTGADGSFSSAVLVFPKSRIGGRVLLATVGAFSANAPFLATPGNLQAPDFIHRR